jgi:transmembrane sensor
MKNRIMGINDKAEIDALISRCLSGEALNEELVRLEKWISETSENRNYYFQIKNLWDVSFGAKDIENIHVERAYRQVIAHSSIGLGAKRLTYYLIRAAAVLFIPLLVGSYFWGRSTKTSADETGYKPVYNEVYAAFGTRSYIALSDGSGVWLNAGSRLKYPDKFTSDKREVYLTGEGYFEVNADASKPFVVNTKDLSVRATGTK